MTPEQKEQIRLVRLRVIAMRDGGKGDDEIKADLLDSGCPAAAILAAMKGQ